MRLPRKGEIRAFASRLIDWSKRHPFRAGLCSVALVAVLVAVMYPMGLLPGHPAEGPAAGQSQSRPKASRSPHAAPQKPNNTVAPPPLTDWRDKPKQHANDVMKGMNSLLDSKVGVNNAIMRVQISYISVDPDSGYSRSETALTDAIKEDTTKEPSSPQEADEMCAGLDALYDQWQTQLWAAANEVLDGQIQDGLLMAEDGRKVIRSDKTTPQSCMRYADADVKTGGSGRADLERKVSQLKEFNNLQMQCSVDMTPEQAARMPQDLGK